MGCCESSGAGKAAGNAVQLDARHSGPKVILSSFAVSGTGTALASCSVEQERAYWEVRVLRQGGLRVGLSQMRKRAELGGHIGDGSSSWGVDLSAGGDQAVKEDDIIGVLFDQSERPTLRFTLNGDDMPAWAVHGIKGTVFPAVSVSDGAIADCLFTAGLFDYPLPERFAAIMPSRSLI